MPTGERDSVLILNDAGDDPQPAYLLNFDGKYYSPCSNVLLFQKAEKVTTHLNMSTEGLNSLV